MRKYSPLPALTLLAVHLSFSGTTGKVAGRVTDAKTNEPLVGVNVVIPGTPLGASTDIDGQYTILNVSPNTYTLKASLLGYNPVTVNGISVSIDLTTRQDFQLTETVVEQKEVVITAERPAIQKDLTATTAIVGKDQIAALPVTEVSQVLSLQAGFVAGSLRGGRSGEVAYWIDGVPVTDAFNGSQVVEINKNLVQEMQLVSGAFNAEYGQAMSGIVNIATKEGGPHYNGSFGVYGGQYATGSDPSTDPSGHEISELFPGLNDFKPTSIRNVEGNLSGPVMGENLTFFANGRYIYFDGWLKGINRFNPSNISYYDATSGKFILYRDPSGRGDSSVVPMNSTERSYAQGKLTLRVSPSIKLTTDYIYDHEKAKAYNRQFFYNPNGTGNTYNTSNTVILQLTQTLGSNTFYTLGASFIDRHIRYYLHDLQYKPAADGSGDLWESYHLDAQGNVNYDNPPSYVHPKLFLTDDSYSFFTGGTDLSRSRRETITKLAKFDISSQVNTINLVKAGVEFRKHHIFLENIQLQPVKEQSDIDLVTSSPFIRTRILPLSSIYHDIYNHGPTEFSGYIQDKLEFKDFIMNIGLRYDYFQPDGVVLNDAHPDPNDPLHYQYTVDDPNIYSPIRTEHSADPLDVRLKYWYKKASHKSQFSPRFGGSFPITATGVVHFSYGHFFQIPRFERLYENPAFKIGFGTGNQGIIGNADLEPEQTINGEIGLQQQLSEDVTVDLTTYLRDIRGLTGTRAEEIIVFGGSSKYSKYVNSDFGTVKGIVFTINKRFAHGISATLDYTYQFARGSASDPAEARNALAGGSLPEVQLTPLGWDQRHTLNVTAAYDSKVWGMSLIGQYGSGTPYTPRRSADITTLLTNSQDKPAFFDIDARAFYAIPTDALRLLLYLRVFNLLDTRNEVSVFDDTGRAGFTTDEDHAYGLNTHQRVNSIDQWFRVPTNYSEPRRIELGLTVEF